jgi:hypothetical protein
VRLLAADLQRREKGRGAIMRRGSQPVFFISFLSPMQPLMSIRVPFFYPARLAADGCGPGKSGSWVQTGLQ